MKSKRESKRLLRAASVLSFLAGLPYLLMPATAAAMDLSTQENTPSYQEEITVTADQIEVAHRRCP
ncbi:hypothetical protein [Desulfobacter postgatei]|jgi:hypothetical protein|uniref:hypothetical protein n=1 Tax=Desulfobacter postgatei TaxID=2293 RepID=UPI002A35E654|nr:hypothetical protein [Desulfobacter postgatei]MDX9964563.1 hypothetical protein [Desulfobacter postgatei]